MRQENDSNDSPNNSKVEVRYNSPNELETLLLCNMSEHFSDLGSEDLMVHHQHLGFAFKDKIKRNANMQDEFLNTYEFFTGVLLALAIHEPLTCRIWNELAEPIKAM